METKICERCGRELPVENFKTTRWGKRATVCTECVTIKLRERKAKVANAEIEKMEAEVKNARLLHIHDFTPRELITELKRRGYTGKLTYVETHVIDMENF